MNDRRLMRLRGGGSHVAPSIQGHWVIHPSQRMFAIDTGTELIPTRYRGISFFRGLDLFVRGADLRPFLRVFDGYNIARVWPYVPWDTDGWDAPPNDRVVEFVRYMGRLGWQVELTLLTDDNPKRIPWALSLIEALANAQLPNLLLEAGNEPLTHKHIDVAALYSALQQSGYLWASGMYEDEGIQADAIRGLYGCAHTPRELDWARRGKGLYEYFHGWSGENAWGGRKMPWVADEPKRPDQSDAEIQWQGRVLTTKRRDYRAYGAVCALMGAGATFHSAAGTHGDMPSEDEQACARELLYGLLAFPADAVLGSYSGTLLEPNAHPDARTYPVGSWMARVWQTGPVPPGWRAIDPDGVCCRKS